MTELTLEQFSKRQVARSNAKVIAAAMYDLGEKSKEKVELALGGRVRINSYDQGEVDAERYAAYQSLDQTSKTIIECILSEQSYSEADTTFDYVIKCLQTAKNVIKPFIEVEA